MEKKINEPISDMMRRLAEVRRRPLSSFVSLESTRTILRLISDKEDDINEQ